MSAAYRGGPGLSTHILCLPKTPAGRPAWATLRCGFRRTTGAGDRISNTMTRVGSGRTSPGHTPRATWCPSWCSFVTISRSGQSMRSPTHSRPAISSSWGRCFNIFATIKSRPFWGSSRATAPGSSVNTSPAAASAQSGHTVGPGH